MSYLNFISCATCHGVGRQALFAGLQQGPPNDRLCPGEESVFFAIPDRQNFSNMQQAFAELIQQQLDGIAWGGFPEDHRWGVIFASTKGVLEDMIWQSSAPQEDPYTPVLNFIKSQVPLPVTRSLTVSNACASSHGAIELAHLWLQHQLVDHVLVVAGDLIGPFTMRGFHTLRALSRQQVMRPFDRDSDGLLLGDGIATVVLSRAPQASCQGKITGVRSLCEGLSATRPDTSGENLARCFSDVSAQPDLLIAHGTATDYNDQTESHAVQKSWATGQPPKITCSKWSVGHSLGASGLVDLCMAVEILKHQVVPGIQTLQQGYGPVSEYLLADTTERPVKQILLSSLGFGGMCAAMAVSGEVNG
jgi:hypothetical protein